MKNPLFLISILMVLALTGCQSSPGGSSLSSSEQESSSSSDSSSSSGSSFTSSSSSSSNNNSSSSSSSSETSSMSIGGDYTSTPTLFFHYHRSDKIYDGWGIWIWLDGASGVRYEFSSTDDYGVYGSYLLSTWGSASKINYIVYKMNGSSWVKDPGQDESLSFSTY